MYVTPLAQRWMHSSGCQAASVFSRVIVSFRLACAMARWSFSDAALWQPHGNDGRQNTDSEEEDEELSCPTALHAPRPRGGSLGQKRKWEWNTLNEAIRPTDLKFVEERQTERCNGVLYFSPFYCVQKILQCCSTLGRGNKAEGNWLNWIQPNWIWWNVTELNPMERNWIESDGM